MEKIIIGSCFSFWSSTMNYCSSRLIEVLQVQASDFDTVLTFNMVIFNWSCQNDYRLMNLQAFFRFLNKKKKKTLTERRLMLNRCLQIVYDEFLKSSFWNSLEEPTKLQSTSWRYLSELVFLSLIFVVSMGTNNTFRSFSLFIHSVLVIAFVAFVLSVVDLLGSD